MGINTEVISSKAGLLKLVTILVGIVDMGLIADKYIRESREEYFLAIVILCFIISLLFMVLRVLGILNENDLFVKVDFVYHVVFGLLLFIGAIVWFVSVSDYGPWQWCWNGRVCRKNNGVYVQRIFAGILGLANSLIYFYIGQLIFKTGAVLKSG